MLFELILLGILLLMVPLLYVLFFTPTLDRILLRLKLGKRADSLKTTVEALDHTVRTTMTNLREEKDAVELALKTAGAIHDRPLAQRVRTVTTHPYVIRAIGSTSEYWSNALGWVEVQHADRFDHADTLTLNLPIGGRWLKQRPPSKRPSKA